MGWSLEGRVGRSKEKRSQKEWKINATSLSMFVIWYLDCEQIETELYARDSPPKSSNEALPAVVILFWESHSKWIFQWDQIATTALAHKISVNNVKFK